MTTTNKNNASQTLFRFVSLRNPQLTETKATNLGFIHRPAGLSSFFDHQIPENDTALSKFQAMERAAQSFVPTGFQNETQIETGVFSQALKIGRKIAKREEISVSDKDTAMALYSQTTQNQYRTLWDNLMFQTARQSDFYVKEAIIHILKALHLGYASQLIPTDELKKINGDDLKAKALEAKVVLPLRFFGEDTNAGGSSLIASRAFTVGTSSVGIEDPINAQTLPVAVQEQLKVEGEKISELSSLNLEKQGLELLISELEAAQKAYYKIKNKAYDIAYKEYLTIYQPEIDEYDRRLREVEARIKETTTQEEIDAMYAELGELNVPQFTFNYKDELNFEDFKTKLSLGSIKLFVNMFTDAGTRELDYSVITVISDRTLQLGEIRVNIDGEYDTYNEVFEVLYEKKASQTQSLFEKTSVNKNIYANIGGILIPVSDIGSNPLNTISRTFYLKASMLNGRSSYLTFYYQATSNVWGVASAKISAVTDLGTYEESYSNISVSTEKITFPPILVNKFREFINNLKIRIFFNNGEEANLELTNISLETSYTGILYTERVKQEIENPTEGGTTPKPGTFIPKHFGVKRLGIADYLKVEQSVHAYVPGEVSNIENVMASELRHKSSVSRDYSEITDTTSESMETEKISDTTKTERNEMQTEVAKELEKQQSITASTRATGTAWGYTLEVAAGYANNTAQHDSTRQAVAKSQEITERAMERVLTKINKERVQKIIKEYTETNVHEFDNRGKVTVTNNPDTTQPQHITGVYRWVDKKMKNQIYNYGKRTMFEFMIPEPAKLHRLSAFVNKETFAEPVDPRKAPRPNTMADSKSATKELLEYWAAIYGVKLTTIKEKDQHIENVHDEFNDSGNCSVQQRNFTVPADYICKSVDVSYSATRSKSSRNLEITGDFTNGIGFVKYAPTESFSLGGFNLSGGWVFKNSGYNIGIVDISLRLNLEIKPALFEAWKKENFDAIIAAYEAAYADFLTKQKEADEKAKEQATENQNKQSVFYRDIESVILKHNCIAYLLQDYLNTLGQQFTAGDQMKNFEVILGEELEQYAALAKFMEQAFEWEIMDYTFYPYYWAHRDEWQKMYLSESADPLFRSFLQSGMARVIVTVKPGFEDAVQFFMTTGRIWNGGEVPVIGDPMYMSIVDEMRQPTGEPQGKYWITRIPTTLTILQAKSVGLTVDQPLPIFPEEHPENCENPKELEGETSFSLDDIRLEGTGDNKTTLPTTIVG